MLRQMRLFDENLIDREKSEYEYRNQYQCITCQDASHPEDLCSCCSRCIDCVSELGHRRLRTTPDEEV